jgi:hypothetical protein
MFEANAIVQDAYGHPSLPLNVRSFAVRKTVLLVTNSVSIIVLLLQVRAEQKCVMQT